MLKFSCKDIDLNCTFELEAEREDVLINMVEEHLKAEHFTTIPVSSEISEKIKRAIKRDK